ncbi:MAG: M23 family metallopeptidase [Saprospiraceae bacterium]|nr:M23 family metallopeptidase [Saprospiraceae bacterium]
MIAILVYTPLGTLFAPPNYMDTEELLNLREKVLQLEESASAQNLYIKNLRQLLSGEVIVDADSSVTQIHEDSIANIPRIEEDEQLRRTFDLDQQLEKVGSNQIANTAPSKPLNQLYLVPPITGSISMPFDPEKNHLGVDINAPPNTAIKSIMDGYIIFAGWTLETGNTIGIQHDNNLISFYKHNSSLLKSTGTYVKAGEAVAIIGNTGTLSSGPHLHFELWQSGKPVDPQNYINFE